jgi:hypothetical protein
MGIHSLFHVYKARCSQNQLRAFERRVVERRLAMCDARPVKRQLCPIQTNRAGVLTTSIHQTYVWEMFLFTDLFAVVKSVRRASLTVI